LSLILVERKFPLENGSYKATLTLQLEETSVEDRVQRVMRVTLQERKQYIYSQAAWEDGKFLTQGAPEWFQDYARSCGTLLKLDSTYHIKEINRLNAPILPVPEEKPSCLTKIWNAICDFFAAIWAFLTGSSRSTPSPDLA
jgi:hypothetical protein